MNPVSAPSLPLGTLPQSHGTERDQLAKAARQFEAIFVRQMLSQARKTNLGGDALLGGQGLDTFRQMQDDRFADLAADSGAFGIARQIEAQLQSQLAVQSPSRLQGGLGEGLLSSLAQQALPHPLPQAGGEIKDPAASRGKDKP